jgi:hypothetical protein
MRTDPPEDDCLEVSLFGPGKGECVVVHLGAGRWITVDSCFDQRRHNNPALQYLAELGVDTTTRVRLIVATHAHDDHFAGIADIFGACPSATFVCSSALTTPEFFALTDLEEQVHAGLPVRAYAEYRRIFELIEARTSHDFSPMRYAWASRVLFADDSDGSPVKVTALSPSDVAFTRAQRALAKAIPKADDAKKITAIDPNELAIALWVEFGDKIALLGADLTPGPTGCGWQAVMATFSPEDKAKVYKVSHHGSITGDHPDIWTQLLTDSPVAILTPFRGKKTLPDPADRLRIYSHTTSAHITAAPSLPAASKQVRREAASLGPLAKNIREPWGRCGHVRVRCRLGETEWKVERFPPAQKL